MNASGFKDYVTDAIKFWERWRLAYNLVLAAIVIIHFAAGYPASKAVLSLDSALGLFLLAVVANIAYCAAYIADIFAQASGFRETLAAISLAPVCDRNHLRRHHHSLRCHGHIPSRQGILKRTEPHPDSSCA